MQVYARKAIGAGARFIGGCCGRTLRHFGAMKAAIDSHIMSNSPTLVEIENRLVALSTEARAHLRGDTSGLGG